MQWYNNQTLCDVFAYCYIDVFIVAVCTLVCLIHDEIKDRRKGR